MAAATTCSPPGPTPAGSRWATSTTAASAPVRDRAAIRAGRQLLQGAFGGSFLNHQYLICACAPAYPNADTAAPAHPTIAIARHGRRRRTTCRSLTPRPTLARLRARWPAVVRARAATSRRRTTSATGSSTRSTRCSRRFQPSGNAPAAADTDLLLRGPGSRPRCRRRPRRPSATS